MGPQKTEGAHRSVNSTIPLRGFLNVPTENSMTQNTTSIVKSSEAPSLRPVRSKVPLDRWIAQCLADIDQDGPLTSLVLEHSVGTSFTHIYTKKIGQSPQDPKDLARTIFSIAETHCQDLPNTQIYRLCAFYNNESQFQTHLPFTVSGRADSDGLMTEGPTKDGLLAHGMRWADKTMTLALNQTAMLLQQNNEAMRTLASMNSRLMHENHEAYDIVKQFMLDRVAAEHSFKMEELKYARDSEQRQKWLSMLPPLANRLTGREIFPQSTEDTVIIERLAKELDVDDLEQLTKILEKKPALLAMLAARFNKIGDGSDPADHTREERIAGKTSADAELEGGTTEGQFESQGDDSTTGGTS
jgi:hypothetical protein